MNSYHLPALQRALGNDWKNLEPAIRQHYSIGSSNENGKIRFEGTMETIRVTGMGKIMAYCARPLQALVPCSGDAIRTEVYNWSKKDSGTLFWRRLFHYPQRKPVVFESRMEFFRDKEIIEFVRGGLGLLLKLEVNDGKLIFGGKYYVLKLAGMLIKLPNWLMAGNAYITESQVGDDQVRVDFDIVHPIWGRTFAYSGTFNTIEN